MASQDYFSRELSVVMADFEPAAINAALAKFAKEQLREVITKGQAPDIYERYVNGVSGAPEEAVKAPGPIVYDFVNWAAIIGEVMAELRKRIIVKSGRYSNSFAVIANGSIVEDYKAIPASAEVIVFNTQPYTRKMESGALKTGAGHFERASSAMSRRYIGMFDFTFKYMDRAEGLAGGVPYILKRHGKRKDRLRGMPITYPSIVIRSL